MFFETEKKTYDFAPINLKEIARYSKGDIKDERTVSLIKECFAECEKEKVINFAVCYTELPVDIREGKADFSAFIAESKDLCSSLKGANSALIFACTVGFGIDRLIKKYSEINPSKSLVFQAIGAERVESFIDVFIADYEKEKKVKLSPRFSAGYGDLSLKTQKDIFNLLNPQKSLGLTLNDSLLMSPSKSVTAFAGINGDCKKNAPCLSCDKKECEYRR